MENEILKQVIEQIKKYELAELFSDAEEFKKWVLNLNNTQINNFLSLNIDLEEIRNLRYLLINENLLNCQDYKQRVNAISSLKNGDGCWHLFKAICSPNFLKSKNFYKDIEMLSKAETARYGLWILGDDNFINSPYHNEDLKLLVETHDTKDNNPLDFVVSEAIASVAANINSIKSPYHREDMKLITTAGSDCLDMTHFASKHGLNNLAINEVSLADKYHSENMQILATNPIANKFLYFIMTDPNFVNGKYYRKEVEALLSAKSKVTAIALYYYMVNPSEKYLNDTDFLRNYKFDMNNIYYISDINSIAGINDTYYLKNLIRINEIDDELVMYFVSLLMNPIFINSPYKNFDLELLQSVTNKAIFMDLYRLMSNEMSLFSEHHKEDAITISQTTIDEIRNLLLKKACNEYSLKSINHEYDMNFISKMSLDSIDEKIYFELSYYLFNQQGIDDLLHKEKLEKLLQGELVERSNMPNYLETLQSQIDNNSSQIIESTPISSSKIKSKILRLFYTLKK